MLEILPYSFSFGDNGTGSRPLSLSILVAMAGLAYTAPVYAANCPSAYSTPGGGTAVQSMAGAFPMAVYAWRALRNKVYGFTQLPTDWDSFGSNPISQSTVDAVWKVVDACEAAGGSPLWVLPTTDETVLLMVRFADGHEFKFEIQEDDAIGVAVWDSEKEVSFHDATTSSVADLIAK